MGSGREAVRGLGGARWGRAQARSAPGSGGLEEGGPLLKCPHHLPSDSSHVFCLGVSTQASPSTQGPSALP